MLDDLNTADARSWSRYICSEHANAREVDLFKQGLSKGKTFGEKGHLEKVLEGLEQLYSALLVVQSHVMTNANKIDSLSRNYAVNTKSSDVRSPLSSSKKHMLPAPLDRPKVVPPQKKKSQII